MNDSKVVINLNFDNSRAHFLRAIQHQLDVVRLLIAGAKRVTSEESVPHGFHNFSPAHGAELSHEQARDKALDWLNNCFLRDSIEETDLFLGRCLSFCAAIELAENGKMTAVDIDHVVRVLPQKHHKIHFPEKIATLERKYGIKPTFSEHVLSLNKIRTCLVHRSGRVSPLDATPNDVLVGRWVTYQMVLRGLETGEKLVLTTQGQVMNEESMLEMHFVEHKRTFTLGEQISLSPFDTYSTIFTLWRFGLACAEAIGKLAIKHGVPINKPDQSAE